MLSQCSILQVEDDANDVFFLEYAFQEVGIAHLLRVVRDGQQAIDYLLGVGAFADRARYPFPCLVLLDLKLPRKDGYEVLRWIREQPEFRLLTVIVLTTTSRQEEIDRCYALGANSFVVKPSQLEERAALATMIKTYWFGLHRNPSVGPNTPRRALAGNEHGLSGEAFK